MAKDAEAHVVERKAFTDVSIDRQPNSGRASESEKSDDGRLYEALDTLDEKIKLLLARYSLLAERCTSAIAGRREAEERLAGMSTGKLDPAALEERMRELETE